MKPFLILYFSSVGNTKAIAEQMKNYAYADYFDFSGERRWMNAIERHVSANKEIRYEDFCYE